MRKITILALSLFVALTSYVVSAPAQQSFLAFANIFTGATQTITSNASNIPVVVPAGGNLLNLQALDVKAMAGTTVADAVALSGTAFVHQITGADGTKGAKFASTTTAGICHLIMNTTAAVAKIYANTGGTVNGGSVDAAFSALTGIKPILCCSTGTDTWICA